MAEGGTMTNEGSSLSLLTAGRVAMAATAASVSKNRKHDNTSSIHGDCFSYCHPGAARHPSWKTEGGPTGATW